MKRLLALLLCLGCLSASGSVTISGDTGGCVYLEWIYVAALGYGTPIRDTDLPKDGLTAADCIRVGGEHVAVNSCNGHTLDFGTNNNGTLVLAPDGSLNFVSSGSSGPGYSGSQSVYNSSSTPVMYAQTENGQMTGNAVIVPPGGTGTLPVSGSPGDGNQWGVLPLPNGSSISAPPSNWTTNPDGSQNVTQATITGAGGSSGGQFYTLSGNSDQPISTNSIEPNNPNWNYGSNSVPPPPSYVSSNATGNTAPVNTNVIASGGNVSGGSQSTNGLTQSNFTSGVNSIIKTDTQNSADLLKAIETMDAANRAGHSNTASSVNNVNNTLGGMSNLLSGIATNGSGSNNSGSWWTNWNWLSSNLLSVVINTNAMVEQGRQFGGSLSNNWSQMSGGVPSAPAIGDGDNGDVNIAFNGFNMQFSVAPYSARLSPFRAVIAWIITVGTWYAMMVWAEKSVGALLNQRQMQGPSQAYEGSNMSSFFGLGYAAMAAASIVAVPLALESVFTTIHTQMGSFLGGFDSVVSAPAWGWMVQAVPVDVMVTAFFTYCGFRFFLGVPLTFLMRGLILFFIN